jgi:hypothetical protein
MKKILFFGAYFLIQVSLFAQSKMPFSEKDKTIFKSHLKELAMANQLGEDIKALEYTDESTKKKATANKINAINRDSTYTSVEIPAVFPGGQDAMGKFLAKNLNKARLVKKNDRVLVKFTVERYGEITKVHVIDGAEKTELSAEAIRLVRLMSYWTPARIQGIDVASTNVIAISY